MLSKGLPGDCHGSHSQQHIFQDEAQGKDGFRSARRVGATTLEHTLWAARGKDCLEMESFSDFPLGGREFWELEVLSC